MIKPIKNYEFCSIGAGYKIHVRAIGAWKAKCGSGGRNYVTARGVKTANANRNIENHGWGLCSACASYTTKDANE